ncbi:fibrocystin-L [Bombina bombina]|uniref:fibrocystin-L n=1 Tax=Bombina bombina TaxID=8345 RepID=UPI00235B274F|nr:fibrocystin-L [Bombina bombina]
MDVIFLLLVCVSVHIAYGQVKVIQIFPNQGSVNGATRITIKGQGFAEANQFNYGAGNDNLGNAVQMVSATLSIPCDVEKDASHSTLITCYTRPMPADTYVVRVSVDGVAVLDKDTCNGYFYSSACRFQTHIYYTPTINSITPASGLPGSMITIQGKIFTDVYGSNTALSSNGRNVRILRVFVGGMPCELLEPNSDNLYGLQLDNQYSDTGSMVCKSTGTYVGHQNVSFILDSNYGRSLPSIATYFVSSINKMTMFQTYAEVLSVSPSVGSVQGGAIITITGRFFDQTNSPAKVLVGGQECQNLGLTDTTITCRVPSKPNMLSSFYPGGRGMKFEVWNNANQYSLDLALKYNETTPGYLGAKWLDGATYSWPAGNNYFVARFSGFLVPPETDYYRLYIKGDDTFSLYFSENGDPASKVKIAYGNYYTSNYISDPTRMSKVFQLDKGKPYYIEAYVQNSLGTSSIDIGLYKYASTYTDQQTTDAVNEVQIIESQSTTVLEKQIITVKNWTTSTAIHEVQTITVTKYCEEPCPTFFYRLIHGIDKTGLLSADATAAEVQSELNSLWSVQPDTVTVTEEGSGQQQVYKVTFVSERGDFQLLSYEIPAESNFTVNITEQTKGVPSMNTYTLVWDGVYSKQLSVHSPAEEIKAAVEEMVGTLCPDVYVKYAENTAVKYFRNYETDFTLVNSNRGILTGETLAFCGRFSIMNPQILYDASELKANQRSYGVISLTYHNQLCFAYKGYLENSIFFAFQYESSDGIQNMVSVIPYTFVQGDSWTYTCINMLDLLKSTYKGKNYNVQTIGLISINSQTNFYIDVLYIGQSTTTDDPNVVRREPALASQGIIISNVEVTNLINGSETDAQYAITIIPYKCGYNFPLFSVGFAENVNNEVGGEETYRATTWPQNSSIQIYQQQAASPPIGGTFSIKAYDKVIQGLPADISHVDLQYALQTIPELGQISVFERTGSCTGYSWEFKFLTATGYQPLLQINDSSVSGINATIKASKVIAGGLFRQRLLGDLVRTLHHEPQVEVYINGIPSKCSGNCSYVWSDVNTPIVNSINIVEGSGDSDEMLIIKGNGFSYTSNNDTSLVTIGDTDCIITNVTADEIKCLVQKASAGIFPVTVYIAEIGFALSSGSNLTYTHQTSISSVTPSSGSIAGGTLVTITGMGFSEKSQVQFGSGICDIIFANLTMIQCRTPPTSQGNIDVVVLTNGLNATLQNAFYYDILNTPVITDISPNSSSVLGNISLVISGFNFSSQSIQNKVFIGKSRCEIVEWNPTNITCILPPHTPGVYEVVVQVDNLGFASFSTEDIASLRYILQVNSILPQHGSLYGGTQVTLTGSGFSTIPEENQVQFGSIPCNVTSSSETKLKCVIQRPGKVYRVTNDGIHPVYGLGYVWTPSILEITSGDTVIWQWQAQPFITGIGYRVYSVSSPGNVTYDGKGFFSGPTKLQSGIFSYQFTIPGIYYYSSGYVDDADTIFLQGAVKVLPAQDQKLPLYMAVGGKEAEYIPDLDAPRAKRSLADCIAEEPTCAEISNVVQINNSILFEFTSCFTPSIISIYPQSGTIYDSIIINGTGFSNVTCANQILVGRYPCAVSYADENSVICNVDPQNSMPVGTAEIVSVTVNNLGNAINILENELDRRFALLSHIDIVTPSNGSSTGNTRLSIHGSGFSDIAGNTRVTIGGFDCAIVSINYTDISCDTLPGISQNVKVNVDVKGFPSQCKSSCRFSYTDALTPLIYNVYPTVIHNTSDTFYIYGSGFGTNVDDVFVYVGDFQINVEGVNDTVIICSIDPLPVGDYVVKVIVLSKGLASGTVTINSPAEASLSPTSGSIQGGTLLLIQGNGFDPLNTTVLVDGKLCQIKSITSGEIQCFTPPAASAKTAMVRVKVHSTTYPVMSFSYAESDTPVVTTVVPNTGPSGTLITVTGLHFGLNTAQITVTIDDAICNVATLSDSQLECNTSDHSGGNFLVQIHNEKGFAKSSAYFKYELTLTDVSPTTGSFGGGLPITVTGSGFDPLTSSVRVCNSECKVDKLRSSTNSLYCEVPAHNGTGTGHNCTVLVANGDNTVQLENAFFYDSLLTPIIYDVSPKRGGTAGGTKLTITGSKFSANISSISVTIAKAPCDVQSANTTHIICTTTSHSPSERSNVKVNIEDQGLAKMENADFFYIDVWSSRYTWGGESPPDEGSLAVITKGQTILLDQSTPVLKMLLIQGGTLIFDEADIELQSENILITDGGRLQIGTEAAPFQHKAIITLHGHLRSIELPVYGAKTLAVREGTLDLHGLPVPITWTRLAQTAEAGDSTLTLQQSVTWKVGDEIVIASTGHRHSQQENEKRTIESISEDGRTLNLTEPLRFKHLGISVTLPDNSVFEARAEVGLLTRNIVIRGSNNNEWNDHIEACPDGFDTGEFATQTCFQGRFGEEIGSDQFGGCIMFHAPEPNKLLSIGRIEYVEIFHAGQAFRLGRYPIHFHLMGDLQFKSYVRGCGIHQTYNRAVTIHNTHHLLVENNVIYDIMGGAFFIEDGIEHGNVLQYNLAVFVRQSTSLLNDDVTPAAFWVTNPNNTIRHNAAAGGTHFGFWYRMHNNPDGPSYDPTICQKRVPLGEFYNNTVHSQGWFGIWIFEEYFPMDTGSCSSTTPKPAIFKSLTTWNCQKGAEWVNGGALQFHNFSMINNELAGIETKRVVSSYVGGWGETNGAVIKNAVIVGYLDELGLGSNYCTSRGIVLPFDEGLTVSSAKFLNFDRPNCAAIGVTSIVGVCSDRCGGWSARFDGIQYFNATNKAGFRWEHEVVLIDMDGTFAGKVGYKVVPKSGLLDTSQCSLHKEWSVGFPGYICNSTVSFHRLAFNNPSPSSLNAKDVIISNSFGVSIVPYLPKRLTHKPGWMALLPNTQSLNWYFKDVDHITNISYASTFYGFKSDDYVIISHNFTQRPDAFKIIDIRNESQQQLSFTNNTNGDWHFDDNTTTLSYLVSGKHKLRRRAVAGRLDPTMTNVNVNFNVYQCFYKNCIPPPPPTTVPLSTRRPDVYVLWSNRSFWESSEENNKKVPQEGSDVVIPAGTWVVADIDIPSLEKLTIYGALELQNNTNSTTSTFKKTVLNATYISIQGGRLIGGWEDDPFLGELYIVLRGNHSTPEMPLPDGPNQGSKVLGVFGQLDLHGIPRSVYKTKLSTTAEAGSNYITLVDAVDWKVGEDVVITTTSYDAWQTETRKIINISPDMKNLTLNSSLTFKHIAKTYQVPGTAMNYTLAADVGLLNRNIKIIGQDYPGWYKESFGARVLVSSFTVNDITYQGSARIDNVEFYHSGQEGFIDPTDPRYSLAFLNLGEVPLNTSYVKGCAFHNGFAPAIGVFGINGLDIDDNVIYFTVGEGIRIWGERIRLRRNLVCLSVWPGTYQDRVEEKNVLWHAGIEINKGADIVLQENIVAGFERTGYRINGEPCQDNPNEEWFGNEAHGGLYGVYMNKDGLLGCSLIRRFTLWKCWDYGIYTQTIESIQISGTILADNGMGILSIIFTPSSVSHETSNKTIKITNCLLVGSSSDFQCDDKLNNSDANIQLSQDQRSSRPLTGGRSGICWPTFASAHNGAPEKPHAGLMSYNAISGLMKVEDTTFVGFRNVCSGETNVMFMTNPLNEDLQHPIHVSGINIVNSSEKQKIFIHRPDLGKVNPSDCVDMDCDAKKKSLLKDLDGSFLGVPGAVIPQSEYEWNGDKRHGVGDYRIPKVMLTRLNGSRIPVSEVAPNKGIIRNSACTYISDWESYKCTGLNYEMLVIESLDPDSETRRLSPVAVLGDGYVDLINGPQDHGWCSGYTCQKRVSLFHSIVATNKSYDIFFSGVSPQNLRLMLLNADSTKVVVAAIYFSTPQRLDVYVDDVFIGPNNAEWNSQNTDFILKPPVYQGQYRPQFNSTVHGENYLDRDYNMLYVLLRGSTPVEIHTTPLIVIAFNIPAMTVNEFYGSNLVRNLALFLKIPANKIRVTKIVAEGSRRRRSTGLTVSVEIADPPSQQRNSSSTSGGLTYSDLKNISTSLAGSAISGSLSSSLNVTISSLAVSEPIPSPNDASWSTVASQTVDRTQTTTVNFLATVASLKVVVEPVAGLLGMPLSQQPAVIALDSNGNCVSVSTSALSLTAKLKDANNNILNSGLEGNTTILFVGCWANYTDLVLKLPGNNYKLEMVLNNVYAQTKSFSAKDTSINTSTATSTSHSTSSATRVPLWTCMVLILTAMSMILITEI